MAARELELPSRERQQSHKWGEAAPEENIQGMQGQLLEDKHGATKNIGLLSKDAFTQCFQIVIPFFTARESRRIAWSLLVSYFVLIFVDNLVFGMWVSTKGNITTALSNKAEAEVYQKVRKLVGIIALMLVVVCCRQILRGMLRLEWRRFTTSSLMQDYLHGDGQAYYRLQFQAHMNLDNPDQRICDDVNEFISNFLEFAVGFVDAFFTGLVMVPLLWATSKSVCVFLFLFAPAVILMNFGLFGNRLANYTRLLLRQEANLRYGLIRVRENAESIAFLRGEPRESKHCENLFVSVIATLYRRMWVYVASQTVRRATTYFTFLMPFAVLAPGILQGKIELGELQKANDSFDEILYSLSYIMENLDTVAELGAEANRISMLMESIASNAKMKGTEAMGEDISFEDCLDDNDDVLLHVEDLCLWPPNRNVTDRTRANALFTGLSLSMKSGESLLISGATGLGKSSFLRVLSRLWLTGHGTIRSVPKDRFMFLPQHPYMCLGTLREQVLYPAFAGSQVDEAPSDEELLSVLAKVNLTHVIERHGLHTEVDFSHALSFGEQQLLSFARLLIQPRSRLALLDESTSALDEASEQMIYVLLGSIVNSFISVGHRKTLRGFHTHVLHLLRLPAGGCIGSKMAMSSVAVNDDVGCTDGSD